MNWETLLCLGDSVTLGTRTYLGFPEITGELLRNHTSKYWNVFNFSKADYTVADLNRLISENFNELKQLTPDLATILIGINDAKKKTSDADFEIIYRQVLLKTKLISKNSRIVVFTIPCLRRGIKLPYLYSMNEQIENYNVIIERLCSEFDFELIRPDLKDAHFFDGIHLNDDGNWQVSYQLVNVVLQGRGFDSLALEVERNGNRF